MTQSLGDIRGLLAGRGLRPKHRLGQNFLHDQNQIRRIVQAAGITPGDIILEVGPGTGTLTEALLEAGARVLAVEVDAELIPILEERLAGYGEAVHILEADILTGKHVVNPVVMAALEAWMRPVGGVCVDHFKLIANLPYQVASPLLVNLALDHPAMAGAVVMVQREVADRLTARPGARERAYGPLGIILQAMCEVERLFTLAPSCFWPAPKIESAVVGIRRRTTPLAADPHAFAVAVHDLFRSRRKQLGSVIGKDRALPPGVERTMRAEELTVEQLAAVAETTLRNEPHM